MPKKKKKAQRGFKGGHKSVSLTGKLIIATFYHLRKLKPLIPVGTVHIRENMLILINWLQKSTRLTVTAFYYSVQTSHCVSELPPLFLFYYFFALKPFRVIKKKFFDDIFSPIFFLQPAAF